MPKSRTVWEIVVFLPWHCGSPVVTVVTVVSAATCRILVTALGRSRGRLCRPAVAEAKIAL